MVKKVIWLLALVLLIAGCRPPARDYEQVSPREKVVLKFSHVVSDTSPKGRAARRWAELVAQRSHGRVEIQVFPNSTLYKDGEELEALQKGYVQIIAPATSKLTKMAPVWQLLDLPFFFNNVEEVHRVVDGSLKQDLTRSLTPKGIEVLAFWDNGFKEMTANRPLRSVQDFQGLRLRIMDSPVLVAQFRRMGAEPVVMPFSDVYSVLERRQVAGSENTPSNIYSKKLYQLQKYVTISNHGYLGYAVLVNSRQWKALPGNVRQLLNETLAEVTAWERSEALRENREDLTLIKKDKKTTVYELSPEEIREWKDVLAPLRRDVASSIGEDIFLRTEKEMGR